MEDDLRHVSSFMKPNGFNETINTELDDSVDDFVVNPEATNLNDEEATNDPEVTNLNDPEVTNLNDPEVTNLNDPEVSAFDGNDSDPTRFSDYLDYIVDEKFDPFIEVNLEKFHKAKLVNNMLNKNISLSTDRVFRSIQLKTSSEFISDFEDSENIIEISDIIATVANISNMKQKKEISVVFLSINKILYKNAPTHFVPLDKINECKFLGSILRFDDLVDCDLKWNGNYGSNIVCDGVCSVLVSFDIKPNEESFEYMINSTNLDNIKNVSISFLLINHNSFLNQMSFNSIYKK